jgi:dihydrodipicolinate synthase/N-acetylneuraminate lyase
MGPWPVLALRDAMDQGDLAKAREITFEITDSYDGPMNLQWRETAAKLAIGAAGYVQPGPLRPPFVEIPAEVQERIRKRAQYWTELCARYRPLVQARA